MDIKWQKNAHILIKSENGFLKVDDQDNIRRTSYLGRMWFQVKDWWTGGKLSQKLEQAIQKTLEAVQKELKQIQIDLSDHLNQIPNTKKISNDDWKDFSKKEIDTLNLIRHRINDLILKGNGGFFLFGIPNYHYRSECMRDIPDSIKSHKQAGDANKKHQALLDIDEFFTLNFIKDNFKKEFVQEEINMQDKTWVG
jgi:hypothetical protein